MEVILNTCDIDYDILIQSNSKYQNYLLQMHWTTTATSCVAAPSVKNKQTQANRQSKTEILLERVLVLVDCCIRSLERYVIRSSTLL